MNKKLVLLGAILLCLLLFGCVNPPKANDGTGSTGTQTTGSTGSGSTAGGNGGEVVVVGGTTGGMSDPSKCNNLPPQEMADCLEQSMGN